MTSNSILAIPPSFFPYLPRNTIPSRSSTPHHHDAHVTRIRSYTPRPPPFPNDRPARLTPFTLPPIRPFRLKTPNPPAISALPTGPTNRLTRPSPHPLKLSTVKPITPAKKLKAHYDIERNAWWKKSLVGPPAVDGKQYSTYSSLEERNSFRGVLA